MFAIVSMLSLTPDKDQSVCQKIPRSKDRPFEKKTGLFITFLKFRVFSKTSVHSKIPRSRDGVLTQNSVFFKNFRVF